MHTKTVSISRRNLGAAAILLGFGWFNLSCLAQNGISQNKKDPSVCNSLDMEIEGYLKRQLSGNKIDEAAREMKDRIQEGSLDVCTIPYMFNRHGLERLRDMNCGQIKEDNSAIELSFAIRGIGKFQCQYSIDENGQAMWIPKNRTESLGEVMFDKATLLSPVLLEYVKNGDVARWMIGWELHYYRCEYQDNGILKATTKKTWDTKLNGLSIIECSSNGERKCSFKIVTYHNEEIESWGPPSEWP